MKDKNVKDLHVLFIEDEDFTREKLGKFLRRKFEKVTLCSNGLEGYLQFQKLHDSDESFDLIISDINMPKMDGIETIEKIRELDFNIPVIFITARSEPECLIKAINLHVDSYILKPLDLEIINLKLEKICQDIYYQKTYKSQKEQMQKYIDIINQEAIVSRMDLDGFITYVNDGFEEVSGYTKEELIGQNYNILRHPEMSKSVFDELWGSIKNGNVWEGVLKEKGKNDQAFFLSTKIMPIFDISGKNITEYIFVSFLVTDMENKKRSQHRKLIEQITEYKKTISKITQDNKELLNRIETISSSIYNIEDSKKSYELKNKQLLQQISAYESNKLEMSKLDLMMKQDKQKQFETMKKSLAITQGLNRTLEKKLAELEKQLKDKIEEIDNFIQKDIENHKRIEDLKDLVTNLQKENEKLKEDSKILPF